VSNVSGPGNLGHLSLVPDAMPLPGEGLPGHGDSGMRELVRATEPVRADDFGCADGRGQPDESIATAAAQRIAAFAVDGRAGDAAQAILAQDAWAGVAPGQRLLLDADGPAHAAPAARLDPADLDRAAGSILAGVFG